MPVYVNSVEIDDASVFAEMQFHPAATQEAARDEAAKALIIRELLRQEALANNLVSDDAPDDDVDDGIMKLIEYKVSVPNADEETCKRYYDQNSDRFKMHEKPDQLIPFDQVQNKIEDYLHTRSVRQGIQFYIQSLQAQANIAGFDLTIPL